jgi:hypothetical protein
LATVLSVLLLLAIVLSVRYKNPEKTPDPPQVNDELYHMMYHVHLAMSRDQTRSLVVIGRSKSNYHTIITTAVSLLIRQ